MMRTAVFSLVLAGWLCGDVVPVVRPQRPAPGPRSSTSQDKIDVLLKAARQASQQGKRDEADRLYIDAMTLLRLVQPPRPHEMASATFERGVVLAEGFKYTEAESLFQDALERFEKLFGADAPETIAAAEQLAKVLAARGRGVEAEPLWRRVVAALERREPQSRRTADALTSLGLRLLHERPQEAEALFRRAVRIYVREASGLASPREFERTMAGERAVDAFFDLRRTLTAQGKSQEADAVLEDILAFGAKFWGAEHQEFARVLQRAAGVIATDGDLTRAEPFLRRALTILEQTGGERSSNWERLGRARLNLASNLQAQGRYSEAEGHVRTFLFELARHSSSLNPITLAALERNALDQMGWLLIPLRRESELGSIDKRRLDNAATAFGRDAPAAMARELDSLAFREIYFGRFAQAYGYLQQAIPLFAQDFARRRKEGIEPDLDEGIKARNGLIEALTGMRRYDEANRLIDQQAGAAVDPAAPYMDAFYLTAGRALLDQAQFVRAAEFFQRGIAVYTKRQPVFRPDDEDASAGLAFALVWQGKTDEAIRLVRELGSPVRPETDTKLALLYERLGDFRAAEDRAARAWQSLRRRGTSHFRLEAPLAVLARARLKQGNIAGALDALKQAEPLPFAPLNSRERADWLFAAAMVSEAQGDIDVAWMRYQRVREMREAVFAPAHPLVAEVHAAMKRLDPGYRGVAGVRSETARAPTR